MRRVLLIALVVFVTAMALLLFRPVRSEVDRVANNERSSVVVPLPSMCDSAHAHVEKAATELAELHRTTSDSRESLAQEQESYPFVPAALIVATIQDEAGHPIHDALVRGTRDQPNSKPITASNAAGMVRLVADNPTASVVISAPGFRSRRFDDVADTDVLTLSRGIGIELHVSLSTARLPSQRLHVILAPMGTVPWFRARGTTDRWTGIERDDGELVQPTHDFMRVFGTGETTGVFDSAGTARVVVSDPGEYEVRLVLGATHHITAGYDMHGAADVEALREITPDPMPSITVAESDEGREFSIEL